MYLTDSYLKFSNEFGCYLTQQGRSPRTCEAYLSDLRAFYRWLYETNGSVSELTVADLTATDAREYRAHLLRRKAAPATINRVLATLRVFAEWAVATGQLSVNPLQGIKGIEEQLVAPKWLEKKQQSALLRLLERDLNAARTEAAQRQAIRDQAIVVLLLNTGLRIGEACALEIGDITLSERKGSVLVRQGKGTKQREVPLNGSARQVLEAWIMIRPGTSPSLFVGQRGDCLQVRAVQRLLAHLGRRASVEVTPHTLRHSFAKNLINAGVSMEKVAALLGHANLNTTRIYTTPSVTDLEMAVNSVGT